MMGLVVNTLGEPTSTVKFMYGALRRTRLCLCL